MRGPFAKGYEQNYTEDFHRILVYIHVKPPVFYEEELQKIIVSKTNLLRWKDFRSEKQGKSTLVLSEMARMAFKF